MYTLYDCHDNISTEGFLGKLDIHQDFHDDDLFFIVFLCSLYVPFSDFPCAFCPATVVSVIVCLVVLGAPFSSEMYFYQLFVLVVLFVCLQWHTVGAEIKVPYVGNPEL